MKFFTELIPQKPIDRLVRVLTIANRKSAYKTVYEVYCTHLSKPLRIKVDNNINGKLFARIKEEIYFSWMEKELSLSRVGDFENVIYYGCLDFKENEDVEVYTIGVLNDDGSLELISGLTMGTGRTSKILNAISDMKDPWCFIGNHPNSIINELSLSQNLLIKPRGLLSSLRNLVGSNILMVPDHYSGPLEVDAFSRRDRVIGEKTDRPEIPDFFDEFSFINSIEGNGLGLVLDVDEEPSEGLIERLIAEAEQLEETFLKPN